MASSIARILWAALLVLLLADWLPAFAQSEPSTPPASSMIQGQLKRMPDGSLVLVPGAPASPATPEQSSPLPMRAVQRGQPAPHATPALPAGRVAAAPQLPQSSAPHLPDSSTAVVVPASSASEHRARRPCPSGAVACVDVVGPSGGSAVRLPLTFGLPFAAGAVAKGESIEARSAKGEAVPLQIDNVATHEDGSMGFAVLSAILPATPGEGGSPIAFYKRTGEAASGEAASGEAVPPPTLGDDLTIHIKTYDAQISLVKFGNRIDYNPGIPFEVGEEVALQLGDDPSDRYAVTVDAKTAGGDFEALTRLSEALMPVINRGQHYKAYKIGGGGGFERLWITAADPPGKPFEVHVEYHGKAKIEVTTIQPYSPSEEYVASERDALAAAQKSGTLRYWLKGPIASEFVVQTPFRSVGDGKPHPLLEAFFHIRAYAGIDNVRSDVIVENDWSYRPNPHNLTYDVAINQGAKEIYAKKDLEHYLHARWHKIFWSRTSPEAFATYDVRYLSATGAIPNYDPDISISAARIQRYESRIGAPSFDPMGNGTITTAMPMVGGREDIGPLPAWAAAYFLSMDPAARFVMLGNGDAGSSAPIHYRDEKTNFPVSLNDHPGMTMQFGTPEGNDAFPRADNSSTPWQPDAAHQPSLDYAPYLATGDLFYLEELQFWANWNMAHFNPAYRSFEKGLVWSSEIRDQAWTLRTLGQAAYITPDGYPMKKYFESKFANNLAWYTSKYIDGDPHSNALHWIDNVYGPGMTAPWMDDFVVLETALNVEMNFKEWEPLAKWLGMFSVGRWINEDNGYCEKMAPAYAIHLQTASTQWVQSWRELFESNWPNVKTCPSTFIPGSFPELAYGYVGVARATLAAMVDMKVPGAREAYDRAVRESPETTRAFADDPTWAIIPRVLP